MFWIAPAAAAPQISPPVRQYVWLSLDDTPIQELPSKGSVELRLRLTVAPDGRVHRCEIERSSGDMRIDAYTCDLARRRALFRPAQSVTGEAMYGVTHQSVVWAKVPVHTMQDADLVVKLSSFPKGVSSPIAVNVKFRVDPAGQVSMCSALSDSSRDNPAWAPAACNELIRQSAVHAAVADGGRAVASIQDATVELAR
jgi:hypothetical protein